MEWLQQSGWLQQFGVTFLAIVFAWSLKNVSESYFKKRGENQAVLADLDKINRQIESIKTDFVAQNSYLSEKGKNSATKEDVKEITHEVESVKSSFNNTVELLKYELSKQVTVHKLAVEREFQVLSEIGIALVEMQQAMHSSRPMYEIRDSRESNEERINRLYSNWATKTKEFAEAIEKHELFLKPALYAQFKRIWRISGEEGLDFEHSVDSNQNHHEAYRRSHEKKNELDEAINQAIAFIQIRFGIK